MLHHHARHHLMATTAFALLMLGTPAMAQVPPTGPEPTPGQEATGQATTPTPPDALDKAANTPDNQSGGLEEIVVTAQKRAENLQSVPISVQAVSGAAIERMQIPTLQGLNGAVTNAQINNFSNTPNSAVVTIRGIGVIEPDPYAGNTVSIVVDGIPQFFSMGALVDLYDIERIEVLKGPQGTLFGANTTGGVVNIVSKQPDDEFGGKIEATAGSWDRYNIAGALNVPITPNLAARFAVSHFERRGFLTNVVTGRDMGRKNTDIYRLTLRYESGNFDATLAGEYDNGRNGAPELTLSAAPAETGPSRVDPSQTIQYGPESLYVDRALAPNMYALPCPSRFERCRAPKRYYGAVSSVPDISKLDTYRASLNMNLRDTALGDITSITGYKKFRVFEYTDQDSSPLFLDDTRRRTRGEQFTQELRTSIDFTDWWNAIGGVFYLKTNYDHVQDFRINFIPGLPGFFQRNLQDQDQWSASVFAQNYFDVTDQLRIQAGIRYTYEKTKMLASTESLLALDPADYTFDCTNCAPAGTVAPPLGKEDWNNVGWKLGVDYKVTPQTLLYASWARGFKSGGFSGRIGIPQDIGPYAPEKVDTFEAGVKTDLFDRHLRVNLTGFYTNYRDMQIAQIYFIGTVQGNTILNVGQAEIKGFELEVTAAPIEGLTLTAQAGYLDAKYKKFDYLDPFSISAATPNGITYDFKGNRLQNAPKWTTVLGFNYEIPMGGEDRLAFGATYKYTSSKILTAINNARRSYVQPTNLVDANIEYFFGDRLSVSLWGRNIFDKRYIQSVYDNFGYGGLVSYMNPRELGVTTRFNF